jgi:hypothetical protein
MPTEQNIDEKSRDTWLNLINESTGARATTTGPVSRARSATSSGMLERVSCREGTVTIFVWVCCIDYFFPIRSGHFCRLSQG